MKNIEQIMYENYFNTYMTKAEEGLCRFTFNENIDRKFQNKKQQS